MGCIYCVTNIQNGKMYIGKAKDFYKRKTRHLYFTYNGKSTSNYNMHIHKAIRKYGAENFSWRILEDNISDDDLATLEMIYIDMFDTYNLGYNSTYGGEGSFGFVYSDEICKKMSQIAKKRPPHSAEHKERISKGLKRTWANKTVEEKEKFRKTFIGRKHTEETKQKIAESNRVREFSDETKKKISESNKGKKMSDSFKKKLRESSLHLYGKPILQYTLDGVFVKEWSNTIDATRSFTDKKTANIRAACIGKQRTAYGYVWKYKNNEDKDTEMYPFIGQYTLDNVLVHEYKNVFEAAEHMEVCASTLLAVCSGARPRASGYIWKIIEKENI